MLRLTGTGLVAQKIECLLAEPDPDGAAFSVGGRSGDEVGGAKPIAVAGEDSLVVRGLRQPARSPGGLDGQVSQSDELLADLSKVAIGTAGRRHSEEIAEASEAAGECELGSTLADGLSGELTEDQPGNPPVG